MNEEDDNLLSLFTELEITDETTPVSYNPFTLIQTKIGDQTNEYIIDISTNEGEESKKISKEEIDNRVEMLKKCCEKLNCGIFHIHKTFYMVRKNTVDKMEYIELNIASVGNVDSGKSTTIEVLSNNVKDNGRGLARNMIFRHPHEKVSGRSSSISFDRIGFDSYGNVFTSQSSRKIKDQELANYSSKICEFSDLCGHEKYFKTTILGLSGINPDYAIVTIAANTGIIGMTKEHLETLLILKIPFFIAFTKIDMTPEHVLKRNLEFIMTFIKKKCRRKPFLIKTKEDVLLSKNIGMLVPIFQISNTTHKGIDLLKLFLNILPKYRKYETTEPFAMSICTTYYSKGIGAVVSGFCKSGKVSVGDDVFIGPYSDGSFKKTQVKTIELNRCRVESAGVGYSFTVALRKITKDEIRKGMVLTTANKKTSTGFDAEILVLNHASTIEKGYKPTMNYKTIAVPVLFTDLGKKDHF